MTLTNSVLFDFVKQEKLPCGPGVEERQLQTHPNVRAFCNYFSVSFEKRNITCRHMLISHYDGQSAAVY